MLTVYNEEHLFENACKSVKTFGHNRESDRQIDID